ncbi:MAG: 50S ribosomal protein L3 [Gemmatimonadetes bacterium]|nr:50S ribosomal protein L3 [Gemmatimonadota bacterium]
MIDGIVGHKKGMTQVYLEDGSAVPVTVIDTTPVHVAQVKTAETDGYSAVQIAHTPGKPKRIGKPRLGHLKKHGDLPALRRLVEFRVDSTEGLEPGQAIGAGDVFTEGERVDVRGVSKGRGFAGTIKRHNFSRGDMTHGGMCKRRPGAIGQCATPARVFKGHKMSGHMGNRRVTVRNLELVRIDGENNYVLVRGAVPGAVNGEVVIRKTKKGVRVPKFKS